jgi:hypothetical protein
VREVALASTHEGWIRDGTGSEPWNTRDEWTATWPV